MIASSISSFADYEPTNLCVICGRESGQGRYCEHHARQVRAVTPQINRLLQLAHCRRVFAAFTFGRIVSRAVRRAQCQS